MILKVPEFQLKRNYYSFKYDSYLFKPISPPKTGFSLNNRMNPLIKSARNLPIADFPFNSALPDLISFKKS